MSILFPHALHRRESGNALLLALLLVMVLTAVASAQYVMVATNMKQSSFYIERSDLDSYAETALDIALHDLRYAVTGNDGNMGATSWSSANDLGLDGQASTGDLGEGDGLPTPGEPNVTGTLIGDTADDIRIFTYAVDSSYALVKHIVATAYSGDNYAVMEAYAREELPPHIPLVGAIYADPSTVLDLRGGGFTINGNDTNPDGTPGSEPAVFGISTQEGAVAGDNANDLIDQVPAHQAGQITGDGATNPSIGETTETINIDTLISELTVMADRTVVGGNYTDIAWGSTSQYEITVANGDLRLGGTGNGYGVLIVEGNLTLAGDFQWDGVVIVRGDVSQVGGGSSTQINGSLLLSSTFSLIDSTEITIAGTADIVYSSQTLGTAQSLIAAKFGTQFTLLYRDTLK